MELQELINLIVNNGVAVAMLIYFCLYNSKQLKEMTEAINSLKELIKLMDEKLTSLEHNKQHSEED